MVNQWILIIDDDMEFCEELAESLRAEGYHVDWTHDTFKGSSLIRDGRHDIILLDYKMKELTGLDILKSLKADKMERRVFLISGKPHIEQILADEGVSHMVSAVIYKPFNFENLLESIKGE